jgi:hypothetical protein
MSLASPRCQAREDESKVDDGVRDGSEQGWNAVPYGVALATGEDRNGAIAS